MDHGCDMQSSFPSQYLKLDLLQLTPSLSRKTSRLAFSIDRRFNGAIDLHRHLFPQSQIARPTPPSCSLSLFSWSSFYHWRSSGTLRSSAQLPSLQMSSSSLACFISLEVKLPSSVIGAQRRFRCSIREIFLCSSGESQLRSRLQFSLIVL